MAVTIQIKRGTHATLPTLAEGELAFETDTCDVYIGDGATNHKVNSTTETDFASIIHAAGTKTPLVAGDELPITDSEATFALKRITLSQLFDDTAGGTDALVVKSPTSNAFYDHGIADTGVHGASANTLLHSGSVIDGGTFV